MLLFLLLQNHLLLHNLAPRGVRIYKDFAVLLLIQRKDLIGSSIMSIVKQMCCGVLYIGVYIQ